MRKSYEPTLTMREARDLYFEENKFGKDGGYNDDWVDFKLGPIPMPFPNTKARKKAIPYHDLHHILTGYQTNTTGEFEISAWEIGAGCRGYVAAWQLNLGGLFAGVLSVPVRTFKAFVRGRRTQSLYDKPMEELLQKTVKEARALCQFRDDETYQTRASDIPLFVLAMIGGLIAGGFSLFGFLSYIPFGIAAAFRRKKTEAKAA